MTRSEADLARSETPPLTIGFSGHRRNKMSDESLDAVGPVVADLLSGIKQWSMADVRLLTSLADGSDLVAATAATNLDIPTDCVIPFGIDEFRADFLTTADAARFDRAVQSASNIHVIDGSRSTLGARNAAYRRVAEVIVARSRILITVWDGQRADGPGGTGELVELACAAGIVVVTIDAAAPHGVTLLTSPANCDNELPLPDVLKSIFTRLHQSYRRV